MRQLTPYQADSLWDFMSDMERAFDGIWRAPRVGRVARTDANFSPTAHSQETEDYFLLSLDLPGVDQKDIKIDVQHGRLTVSGERQRYGRFERSFQLPQNVNEDKIQARSENGVLEILIPKAEIAKPRSIPVEGAKAGGLFSGLLKKSEESAEKIEQH